MKRHLPPAFCRLPIYVSPEASLRYWLPMSRSDGMLYRMAKELVRPGAIVWDVGANVGLFSVCASALAGPSGRVLAIEPDIWLCQLLARTAAAQKDTSAAISVLCAAVSEDSRITQLQIAERCRAANHLQDSCGSSQVKSDRASQATVTVSLDFLLDYYAAPSVVKIDVETHENRVLSGASRLLKTARPTIWCEVSPENSIAVCDFLHEYGYELYAAATPQPREPLARRASWDTLAVPK